MINSLRVIPKLGSEGLFEESCRGVQRAEGNFSERRKGRTVNFCQRRRNIFDVKSGSRRKIKRGRYGRIIIANGIKSLWTKKFTN